MAADRPSVLVVTSRFPYPAIGGDRLRVFHLVRVLSRRFTVNVLSLGDVPPADRLAFIAASGASSAQAIPHGRMRALWGTARALLNGEPLQVGYFRSRTLDAAVADQLGCADVLFCHLIRTSAVWRSQRTLPAVLDLCDAISSNYAQVVRTTHAWKPWNWVSRIEEPRVREFERREIGRFDLVTLVSEADAGRLGIPPERWLLLTQGVDLSLFKFRPPPQRCGRALALIGKFDTYPNSTGARWFAREVLPRLPAGTRLKLIGDCPPGLRREFERLPSVEVTGRVADISAACSDCRAAVAPLDIATGIQNKVLEYFAMGLPAVLSPSVRRGLMPASAGCFLEAEGTDQWVAQLSRLDAEQNATAAMTRRARSYVESWHNWDRIGDEISQRILRALSCR